MGEVLLNTHNSPSSIGEIKHSTGSLKFATGRPRIACRILAPMKLCRGNVDLRQAQSRTARRQSLGNTENRLARTEEKIFVGQESNAFHHVQTLRNYPVEELFGKITLVRVDSTALLENATGFQLLAQKRTISTIKYLHDAGAKVLILSSWVQSSDPVDFSAKFAADHLSSLLRLKVMPTNGVSGSALNMEDLEKADVLLLENLSNFKEEVANCPTFSRKLSSGVDIFVNDAFSISHKTLASNVGVTCFCFASIAGFHFEEELSKLQETTETTKRPFIVIIGGGNFIKKAAALRHLAYICDGLVFVGKMAFQIMNALGWSVSLNFVDQGTLEEALKIIHIARDRKIPILFPKDFQCVDDHHPGLLDIFPADGILSGWTPVDLGPGSIMEIYSLLSECKKILCIGPVKFGDFNQDTCGVHELTSMLESTCEAGCDVTVICNTAYESIEKARGSISCCKMLSSSAIVWEFLNRRALPGVAALDRAYPFAFDWDDIFDDPFQPLTVDIGSGNGLFLLKMAERWKTSNFLGLEINKKLVQRCLSSVIQSGLKNSYFISTNATSTFRSIISSYPGELVLVSIQCPNPDFNRPEHRWRMLQRTLIEAIADLLATNGKIFLQSDIEAVAAKMKEQFIKYGKGKLAILDDGVSSAGWMEENPFGIHSDWEQHVVDRGAPMFRLMLKKLDSNVSNQNS